MLFIIKLALAIVIKKLDVIIKNFYFKFLPDNISLSIFERFSLKKVDSNIKIHVLFCIF